MGVWQGVLDHSSCNYHSSECGWCNQVTQSERSKNASQAFWAIGCKLVTRRRSRARAVQVLVLGVDPRACSMLIVHANPELNPTLYFIYPHRVLWGFQLVASILKKIHFALKNVTYGFFGNLGYLVTGTHDLSW